MSEALGLAKQAKQLGEVPVGALVVLNGEVIGRGYNRSLSNCDPCGHAEILAIRDAAKHIQNYRLTNATLYVSLEPCIMCAGAILHARIKRLVFAARDTRFGAAGSQLNLLESIFLNHQTTVTSGVLQQDASDLLAGFFSQRRT